MQEGLIAGGGLIARKLIKWSLMSDMIVPVWAPVRASELVRIWSIRELVLPWILVDFVFRGTNPLLITVLR